MYQFRIDYEQLFPLHPAQESVYFDQILEPDSPKCNIGAYHVIDGDVDVSIYKQVWALLDCHADALRLNFLAQEDGKPAQYVRSAQQSTPDIRYLDFSMRARPEHDAIQWMQKQLDITFDCQGQAALYQAALINLGSERYFSFVKYHHIIIDGVGAYRLLECHHRLYANLSEGTDHSWLNELGTYRQEILKARQYLSSPRYYRDEQYWQGIVAKVFNPVADFCCGLSSRDAVKNRSQETLGVHSIAIPKALTLALQAFCESTKHSKLTLLTSAISVYFFRVTGRQTLAWRTAVHGRRDKQALALPGMFTNVIPLLCDIDGEQSFSGLLEQVGRALRSGLKHSRYPSRNINQLARSENKTLPELEVLYDVVSNPPGHWGTKLKTTQLSSPASQQGLQIRLLEYQSDVALRLRVAYSYDYFSDDSIRLLTERLLNLLTGAIAEPETKVGHLPLLLPREQQNLLHTANKADTPYLGDATLHQLFEQQVAQTPNNPALCFEDQTLSYQQLNEQANRLAHVIRASYSERYSKDGSVSEMPADTFIALYLDRSPQMLISLLAVLKAGGAYVPISPGFPKPRALYMLQDTQAPLVLSASEFLPQITPWLSELAVEPLLLCVDSPVNQLGGCTENPHNINQATDLAYVLYTSGTTGTPKGVLTPHKGVVSLIINNHFADLCSGDTFLHLSSPNFDAATFEIWGALLHGANSVVTPSSQNLSAEQLRHLLIQHRVSVLWLTRALFDNLYVQQPDMFGSLRYLFVGGEALTPGLIRQLVAQKNRPKNIVNGYGPTESTTFTTTYCCDQFFAASVTNVPLGKAINTRKLYVLDAYMQLLPIGAVGELYIGGAGLAREYLNQPDLTQACFLNNPFVTKSDLANGYTRLYKTGDLVRFLGDGEGGWGDLEYLGRNDSQVKIRGYRIELAEVESVLLANPEVKQAVVIDYSQTINTNKDGELQAQRSLAAYIVAENSSKPDFTAIHHDISARLPDYMIPSSFTEIAAIPLTPNGKLDRSALPEPKTICSDNYLAPRSELERHLCDIWQQVLGLKQVGLQDNFFRIGGDSIISIQLVSKLRQLGMNLPVKAIFDAPTVAQLAEILSKKPTDITGISEQGELRGEFDLLPIQQWFFEQAFNLPNYWNQAFMLVLPGYITLEEVEDVVSQLAQYHDVLRLTIDGVKQRYLTEKQARIAPVKSLDVSAMDPMAVEAQLSLWQSTFSLDQGPMWQTAHLTDDKGGSARLWFSFHHLIIDVVSWRIIAEDVQRLLCGGQSRSKTLSEKGSSYRQWVEAVKRYALDHQQEAVYWNNVLSNPHTQPTSTLVPTSTSAPTSTQIICEYIELSVEHTTVLLREANQGYHTEVNDLLLAALALALETTFNQVNNMIALEGHGREAIDERLDISHTVGWFTTIYPLRLMAQASIKDTIIHTKETLRALPNKGLGFGALRQSGQITGDLPALNFNYLGQLDCADSDASSDWQLLTEHCGQTQAVQNQDGLLLNIYGAVQAGRLTFSVASRLPATQNATFTQAFELALIQVIKHSQSAAEQGGVTTPSDHPIKGLSIAHLRHLQSTYTIEAIYPATHLQEGFIFHYLKYPKDDAYYVQILLDMHFPLDIKRYQQAWRLASQRYPILRAAFNWRDSLVQVISADASINEANFTFKDLSALAPELREQAINEIQQEDRTRFFDLTQPGLIRITIIKQDEQCYTVLKCIHHSIIDGWSVPLLTQCVDDYYQSLTQEKKPITEIAVEVERTYLDVQTYKIEHRDKVQAYWGDIKQTYGDANDINPLLSYPLDLTQGQRLDQMAVETLQIQGSAYDSLKTICRQQGVTFNVALQFAWHKLLQCYTHDEQTIVGTTVSGRELPIPGIESSVGLYINTLPLAVCWSEPTTIAQQLHNIQEGIAQVSNHSNISLVSLQNRGAGLRHGSLFHTLLIFENYPLPFADDGPGPGDSAGTGSDAGADGGIAKRITLRGVVEKMEYPLSIQAYDHNQCLVVPLRYNPSWLTADRAAHLLQQLEYILTAVCINPNQSHQDITLNIDDNVNRYEVDDTELLIKREYVAPRNSLEKSLCEVWQSVLATAKIGIEDNFFGVGGNSIVGIELVAKMDEVAEVNISLSDLFAMPCIALLADCFSKAR